MRCRPPTPQSSRARTPPAHLVRDPGRGCAAPRLQRSGGVLALMLIASLAASAQAEVIEVFQRDGCPHCVRAEEFLDALHERRPEITVVRRDVVRDPEALARLRQLAAEASVEQLAVPAIYVRGRLFVGFARDGSTGRAIEAWLDGREERGDAVRLPLIGGISVREVGLPLFTLAVGLIDGFNPCAMWVLLFLLSLLVNVGSRARMAAIGGTFVVVSGVVYYAFMAAWLSVYAVVGFSRAVQVVVGVVAVGAGAIHIEDFFALGKGPTLAIPARAKPGIYARVRRIVRAESLAAALAAAAVLAFLVNLVELLCTAGLPAIYTQILTAQDVPAWQHYGYLLLYIAAYMVDDALMLTVAVVTLGRRKLQERGGRVLALISGSVLAVLGVAMLVRPSWLSFGAG